VSKALLESIFECVYRGELAAANLSHTVADVDATDTPSATASTTPTSPAAPVATSYWSRLTSYFSGTYADENAAATPTTTTPDVATPAEPVSAPTETQLPAAASQQDASVSDAAALNAIAEREMLSDSFNQLAASTVNANVC
jgi:hypothetical protein